MSSSQNSSVYNEAFEGARPTSTYNAVATVSLMVFKLHMVAGNKLISSIVLIETSNTKMFNE